MAENQEHVRDEFKDSTLGNLHWCLKINLSVASIETSCATRWQQNFVVSQRFITLLWSVSAQLENSSQLLIVLFIFLSLWLTPQPRPRVPPRLASLFLSKTSFPGCANRNRAQCVGSREITRDRKGRAQSRPDGQEAESAVWLELIRGRRVNGVEEIERGTGCSECVYILTRQESTERASSYCIHRLSEGIPGRNEL